MLLQLIKKSHKIPLKALSIQQRGSMSLRINKTKEQNKFVSWKTDLLAAVRTYYVNNNSFHSVRVLCIVNELNSGVSQKDGVQD